MAFNFKNNNLTIILLLILVIGSSMCYLMMEKNIEGFVSNYPDTITNKFTQLGSLSSKTDRTYIMLDHKKKYVFKSDSVTYTHDSSFPNEVSGNFSFYGQTLPQLNDMSFNAYLYNSTNGSTDLSYNIYNSNLNLRLDLSSINNTGTGAEDLSGTTNILMVIDNSGNLYDLCGNLPLIGFDLILDEDYLFINGVLKGSNITDTRSSTSTGNNSATGWSGDINFKDMFKGFNNGQLPPNMTPEMYAYMLHGSMGSGNQGYAMPFYNSFESAMNNPSNPLVNPTNTMNPLQYNQSLFGPNVSPMMSQNMCKNSSADKGEKVIEDDKTDSKTKDSSINSSLGSNNVLNSTFDKLNSSANTMLAQNTGDEGKGGSDGLSSLNGNGNGNGNNSQNSSGNPPPCPPCARCPESNYECKKVPAYEQGYENTALPRPVLSDFSTFGM